MLYKNILVIAVITLYFASGCNSQKANPPESEISVASVEPKTSDDSIETSRDLQREIDALLQAIAKPKNEPARSIDTKDIRKTDVNGDGVLDAVIAANTNLDGPGGGNATFDQFFLSAIISNASGYTHLTEKFGSTGKIIELSGSDAKITYSTYADGDPSCCRSLSTEVSIAINELGIKTKKGSEIVQKKLALSDFSNQVFSDTPVSALISTLGESYKFTPPDVDDPSPWGQELSWIIDKSAKVLTLIPDDKQDLDTTSGVSLIRIEQNDSKHRVDFGSNLITGLTTDSQLLKKLNSDRIQYSSSSSRASCQGKDSSTLRAGADNEYTYYHFNKGLLCGLTLAAFDIDNAD